MPIQFQCENPVLQTIWDRALLMSKENLRLFAHRTVLVEGGGYEKIWLETQPMGGEMYFPFHPEAAFNNISLFMEYQREDGRLPGSIALIDGKLVPQFNKLQGFCFPLHAMNLYYLMGENRDYLKRVQRCLTQFDRWLWQNRDSNGDGLLESFCVYDTGEDGALRYGDAPCWWEREEAPEGNHFVPMASMDMMSFSYACRDTLAKISRILGDGSEGEWENKAREVQDALREKLWDNEKSACFDIYPTGKKQTVLTHNNLRCMYFRSFTPDMARAFAEQHLMNPREFFTPMPLPSVAVNDPLFLNERDNNWSGQSEGLTWQRSLFALENYGMEKYLPVLGKRLFDALERNDYAFVQQYDPFTGEASMKERFACYGPTILSALGYILHLYGVYPHRGEMRFALLGGIAYTLDYDAPGHRYRIQSDGKFATIHLGDKQLSPLECGYIYTFHRDGSVKEKTRW